MIAHYQIQYQLASQHLAVIQIQCVLLDKDVASRQTAPKYVLRLIFHRPRRHPVRTKNCIKVGGSSSERFKWQYFLTSKPFNIFPIIFIYLWDPIKLVCLFINYISYK